MSLVLFSFVFDTDTKQAVITGNVEPQTALQVLQSLVIADAIKKAGGSAGQAKEETAIIEEKGSE